MQYKTLVNPSFLILMMEVQSHIQAGWTIDENNYPAHHFVYFEVNLVKDEFKEAILEVFPEISEDNLETVGDVPVVKKAGRPARAKMN